MKGANHGSLDSPNKTPMETSPPVFQPDKFCQLSCRVIAITRKSCVISRRSCHIQEAKIQGNTVRTLPSSADNYQFIQRYLSQLQISFNTLPSLRSVKSELLLRYAEETPPHTTPLKTSRENVDPLNLPPLSTSLVNSNSRKFQVIPF